MKSISVITEQRYSIKALKYIQANIDDENWVRDWEVDAESIKAIKTLSSKYVKQKHISNFGKNSVTYSLSTNGAGKLGYGRLYGSAGSLERMHRPLRHMLCADLYWDIDIKNAQPVILWQFAKQKYNYELPETKKYCDNRDAYLSMISGDRDKAKQGILQAIFIGNPIAELIPMKNEILAFAIDIYNRGEYSDLFPVVSQTNIFGSYLAQILQTEERHIMLLMKEKLEQRKYIADILAYDGLMIRKEIGNEPTQQILDEVIQYVLCKTAYAIELSVKEMISKMPVIEEQSSRNDEVAPNVSRSEYEAMKARFEKIHFYFVQTDLIGWFNDNTGELKFIPKVHALNLFAGSEWHFKTGKTFSDYTLFFPLWFKDPNRRNVYLTDFKETDDPSVFVKPLMIKYKLYTNPHVENTIALEYFNNLIDIASNNKANLKTYLLSYLAHIIQKPLELPCTALVLTGAKRIGKDTLMDFFGKHVLGDSNFKNYDSNTQFFDPYDVGCDNKFMVKLEEADLNMCRKNSDKLKSRISCGTSSFNPKGKSAYTSPNYTRYIFTTNKANPFDLSDGERRYVILACSPEKKDDMVFWTNVRQFLFNDSAGHVVGKYLEQYNIADWNPRKLPDNEYQNTLHEVEKNSEELFFESHVWSGSDVTAQELFNIYKEFCLESQLPSKMSTLSFSKSIQSFVRDGKISYKKGSGNVGYYSQKNT